VQTEATVAARLDKIEDGTRLGTNRISTFALNRQERESRDRA
jgi:hypothetical protein